MFKVFINISVLIASQNKGVRGEHENEQPIFFFTYNDLYGYTKYGYMVIINLWKSGVLC